MGLKMLQDEAEAEPKSVRWKRAKARLKKPACQTKTKGREFAVNRYVDDLRNYTGAADHPDWAAHAVSILQPYLRSLSNRCIEHLCGRRALHGAFSPGI